MVTEGGVFGNERLEDIVVQELIQTFGYVLDEKQRLVI